jgi:DNA-directed RNA polymerase subunit alpha
MARKNLLKGFKNRKALHLSILKRIRTTVSSPHILLRQGFGTTIGNTLRRILLSSIQGYAVTSVRITSYDADNVPHVISSEFEAIPNVEKTLWKF